MPIPPPLQPAHAALSRRDFSQVLELTHPFLQHRNTHIRSGALRLRGEAALELGELAAALNAVQSAATIAPAHGPTWFLIGRVLQAMGHQPTAIQAYRRATRLQPALVAAWLALAELLRQPSGGIETIQVLYEAMLLHPTRTDITLKLLDELLNGQPSDIRTRVFHSALQRFPRHPEVHERLSRVCLGEGDDARGRQHLDTAIALDPGNLSFLCRRAELRIRSQDTQGAFEDIEAVLQRSPLHADALLGRAKLHIRSGAHARALEDLDQLLAHAPEKALDLRSVALAQRGLVREAIGEYQPALEDFQAGQSAVAASYRNTHPPPSDYLGKVRTIHDTLRPKSPLRVQAEQWSRSVPEDWPLAGAPPVFVFGFPRSGTTLVEHILGAHPHLAPTDERNVLGAALTVLHTHLQHKAPRDLTDAERVQLRLAYGERARELAPGGERVVDKVPLNFVHVELVRRVFPDAPILFLLRDPRDCVWSAFTQTFQFNAAMVHTTTLEGTAHLYETTMGLWLSARELPGLRYTELRYEDLVTDIEAGARALVAAAGLPWHDDVLRYREALGKKMVRTPSFAAIAKPVSTTRIGRWKHFPAAMASVQPTLAPFLSTFGYADAPT